MSTSFRRFASLAAVVVAGWAGSAAYAAPLNLLKTKPDLASDGITITYSFNSGTGVGTFNAVGFAETIAQTNGSTTVLTSGAFSLNVNLQVSGTGAGQTVTPINGSLSITSVPGHNWFSSSNFQSFGFTANSLGSNNPSSQFFEFVFRPGSGELLPANNSIGVIIGAQVTAPYTINSAMFTNAFQTSTAQSATADAFAVPLPPAAMMGLSGLAALPLMLRRRKA